VIGIKTVGDLAAADLGVLQTHFGTNYAAWLARVAHGLDDRPIVVESEPKSMSRETTFERDLHPRHDRPALSSAFTALCARVSGDLQHHGYVGQTIGLKLRFDDFRTVTRDVTLPLPTADAATIRAAATECLKRITLDRKLRLLGVRVGSLQRGEDAANAQTQIQAVLPFGATDTS
jgi:DNA polymerase IV